MTGQKTILNRIKKLSAENHDIAVVWLYGSRAGGQYNQQSDFDLAIAFNDFGLSNLDAFVRPNELAMEWAIELRLAEDKISLVDINRAPIYLAYNIVEYGEILYQTETMRAFKEQDRIYSQYEFQMIESGKYAQ